MTDQLIEVAHAVCRHCGAQAPSFLTESEFPHYADCPKLNPEPTETSGHE